MATIFAGTAYNQVIEVYSEDKTKQKVAYRTLGTQPVQHISTHQDNTVFATPRTVTSIIGETTKDIVALHNPQQQIVSL